jgi:hypothetical protein
MAVPELRIMTALPQDSPYPVPQMNLNCFSLPCIHSDEPNYRFLAILTPRECVYIDIEP